MVRISIRSGVILALIACSLAWLAPLSHAAPDAPATAPAQPAAAQPDYTVIQDRPDRLMVMLPNRLIVLVQEVRTAPVVSAQVWVKTGSIYEQEHVGAGLSHFLEHLLAGGSTKNRKETESKARLGAIGAHFNATTSLESVRYYVNTTSSNWGDAVDLLSDWMQNSLITEEEYKRERDVIQREFDMGNGEPGRIMWKLTQLARYNEHPARHPTIGYIDEFLHISRDEIYDFYKRMYVPNNMLFVVVGDVDRKAVVSRIAELWKNAKPGKLPELSFPVEKPPTQATAVAGYAAVTRPRLRLAWPSTRLAAEGDYALDLLAAILGHGEASRLTRTVRDEQRVVYSVDAYNMSYHWGEGMFGVDADVALPPPGVKPPAATVGPTTAPATQPQDPAAIEQARRRAADAATAAAAELEVQSQLAVERARNAILAQIAKIQAEGVTEEELARAKRQTLASTIYGSQTAEAMADRFASDVFGTADPDYFQHYVDRIQKVTAGEVVAAAQRFLVKDKMLTVSMLPIAPGQSPEPMKRPPEPAATTQPSKREPVVLDNILLVDRMKERLAEADSAGKGLKIEPVKRVTLPNGLRVLVQRSTLVPAVSIQFYHFGGLLADTTGREGVANAAATMLTKGTPKRTADQLSDEVEALGAGVSSQCGNNTWYTRGTCLKEDWRTILSIVADTTLNASFPEDEWKKLQPRLLAAIARENDNWSGELSNRFRQTYLGEHPWASSVLGRAKVVETLTAKELAEFHRQRLGASNAVLAIIGDIDPDEAITAATDFFGALPEKPAVAFEPQSPTLAGGKVVQFQTNKPLAAVVVGLGPTGTRMSPEFPAMQVLSRVLSSFPSGWLEEELRGRGPGLVYAVGGSQAAGYVPGYYRILFNTKPASAAEAINRTMGVVERIRTKPVDDATLARAKAGVLTDEFFGKQSNSDRAAEAAINELYGLGQDEPKRFLEAVQKVDAKAIMDTAKQCLVDPTVVLLTASPLPEDELKASTKPPATTQPAPAPEKKEPPKPAPSEPVKTPADEKKPAKPKPAPARPR